MPLFIKNVKKPNYNKYIISISFINYLKVKNGIAKVHTAHQNMFNQKEISYIHLFVVKKMMMHDKHSLFCYYGLIVDGEYQGIFSIYQVIQYLNMMYKAGIVSIGIHVHHLMYIRLPHMKCLLDAIPKTPIYFYLHDYYLMCWKFTLLNSNNQYCGNHGLNEKSCNKCDYYQYGVKRDKEIKRFLKCYLYRSTFVSPSNATRDIFLTKYPEYEKSIIVLPHQVSSSRYNGNTELINYSNRLKIAYLAMPAEHKGWNEFKKCADRYSKNYDFYVFNGSIKEYDNAKKICVSYSDENLNAMTDALRKEKIDVVMLWAHWPETYSYTCMEAYSANCYIITNNNSGNITDLVRENGNGIILNEVNDIDRLLNNKKFLIDSINLFREKCNYGPDGLSENDAILNICIKNMDFEFKRYEKRMPDNLCLRLLLNRIVK